VLRARTHQEDAVATPESKPAGKVQVQIPANLEPIYANFALITNSASEIVIDFAQVMPQVPTARVRSRVVLTALNAKLVLRALGERMNRYEEQSGGHRPGRPALPAPHRGYLRWGGH
jgi:hypothetical protein